MSFPLYENLLSRTTFGDPIDQSEIQFFMDQVKEDTGIHELVYAIIRCYQLHEGSLETYILPYGGRKLKKGIKFDFDKFPEKLQHLLLTFITLHRESQQ